jgi:hypothetical protein
MTEQSKPDTMLWLNDSRGQYIPRDFANSFKDRAKNVTGVSTENWKTLEAGPDHEWYWEAWDEVLQDAVVTDDNGVKFTLYQEGDLWLIPEGMEWSDAENFFIWPSTGDDDDESEEAEGPDAPGA